MNTRILALALALTSIAYGEVAFPPKLCNVHNLAYDAARAIPANAPAIPVFRTSSTTITGSGSIGGTAFTVTADGGKFDTLSLLSLAGDLPVGGPYPVEVTNIACAGLPNHNSPAKGLQVKTLAVSPLPTSLGDVSLNGADLRITPAPELTPFLPVAKLIAEARGTSIPINEASLKGERGVYGVEVDAVGIAHWKFNVTMIPLAWCEGNTTNTVEFVVRAQIAGAKQDLPSSPLSLAVDCEAVRNRDLPTPVVSNDAGVDGVDGINGDVPAAGEDEGAATNDSSSGCSTNSGRPSPSPWGFPLAALFAIAMAWSRRKQG